MLIIHHTLHNNRKKVLIVQHTLENRPKNEILSYTRMLCGQNRSARENKRKREISRDFSRFFDPEFFRSFIDPFCPFRCSVRTRTHEKGFFASYRKQSTLWLDSDLRKRSRTVWKSCRFTNCLQTQLIPPQIVRIQTHESEKSVCYQFVESISRSAVFLSKFLARLRLKIGKIYGIIKYR